MHNVCVQSKLVKLAADAGLTLAYSSESSIEAELTRESTADILTVVVSMGGFSNKHGILQRARHEVRGCPGLSTVIGVSSELGFASTCLAFDCFRRTFAYHAATRQVWNQSGTRSAGIGRDPWKQQKTYNVRSSLLSYI